MSSKRKYPGNPNYGNYKEPPKDVDKEKRMNIIKLVIGFAVAIGGFVLGIFLWK